MNMETKVVDSIYGKIVITAPAEVLSVLQDDEEEWSEFLDDLDYEMLTNSWKVLRVTLSVDDGDSASEWFVKEIKGE